MADDVMLCECEGLGQELFVLAEVPGKSGVRAYT